MNDNLPNSLPSRVTDPDVRAPVVLGPMPHHHLNHVLRLPGRPEQAAVLRGRLGNVVPGFAVDSVLVLAGELFGNAIAHTRSGDPGGEVVVVANRLPGRLQVKVVDQGPRGPEGTSPHLRPLDPGREGGLGLRLVDAEASRWGTHHDGDRTTVWFELDRDTTRM